MSSTGKLPQSFGSKQLTRSSKVCLLELLSQKGSPFRLPRKSTEYPAYNSVYALCITQSLAGTETAEKEALIKRSLIE